MDYVQAPERMDRRVGVALAVLIALTVLFLGLSFLHRRPMDAFELRASSFAGFVPVLDDWAVERRPVSPDPIEPNILCYRLTPRTATLSRDGSPRDVTLRLVHGYNVRDCMRIKGYSVEEMPNSGLGESNCLDHTSLGQLWRMVSPTGVTSLWTTAMLRSDTFEATDRDVCSMPFPRVGVPDDPDWSPGGITAEGLMHPVSNARRVVRAKWNASRSDLLIFLGFRRPTWVQSEWLTLVVSGEPDAGSVGGHAVASLWNVQSAFARELRMWKKRNQSGGE